MEIKRTFLIAATLVAISLILNDAFAQEAGIVNDKATCVKDAKEPSRKICVDKSAQSYLKENFYLDFKASDMLSNVVCDWDAHVTKGASGKDFGITCQNQDSRHKIVFGWTSVDKKYVDILVKLALSKSVTMSQMQRL